jgi:hypothetical protein
VGRVFERPAKENQNQIKIKMLTLKKVTGGGGTASMSTRSVVHLALQANQLLSQFFFTEVHGTKNNFLKCS